MDQNVPATLRFVESFLNSVDVDSNQDDLDSVVRFRRWLSDHGQLTAAESTTESDLEFARQLRTELRAIVSDHDHQSTIDFARLDGLTERIPLRAQITRDGVTLAPLAGGVAGMLGDVVAAIVHAWEDGAWKRLKLCRSDACQQVFYDRSKNGSRCWCSMDVCGNRNKTRAYRRRQGSATTDAEGSA